MCYSVCYSQAMTKNNETGRKTTHTPGPWECGEAFREKVGSYEFTGFPISGGGRAIARVWTPHHADPVAQGNARLIKSAPELLDLLRRAQVCCETAKGGSARALVHEIRAAIAEVEGR